MPSPDTFEPTLVAPGEPRRPMRLHHHAFVTTDLEATRHFYEDVIGMPLIATWTEVDRFPDRERIYCHAFFEMADGSALAFFQFEDPASELPVATQQSPSVHVAMLCDAQTQADILGRLRASGYEDQPTPGYTTERQAYVMDHGYCVSLYVYDPNGLRLEFTVDHPDYPSILEQQRPLAHDTLRRWLGGDHTSNNTFRPEH